jgi:hypothetical protein
LNFKERKKERNFPLVGRFEPETRYGKSFHDHSGVFKLWDRTKRGNFIWGQVKFLEIDDEEARGRFLS